MRALRLNIADLAGLVILVVGTLIAFLAFVAVRFLIAVGSIPRVFLAFAFVVAGIAILILAGAVL